MLSDILLEQYIRLDVKCKDWKEAIRESGRPLVEDGVCNQTYVEECVEAVKEFGPYIVITKHVAIPHATNKSNVIKTGISLIRLAKAVNFGNSDNDPVKYVFMLATVDGSSHMDALGDLVDLLSQDEFMEIIDKADNPSKISDFIIEFNGRERREVL